MLLCRVGSQRCNMFPVPALAAASAHSWNRPLVPAERACRARSCTLGEVGFMAEPSLWLSGADLWPILSADGCGSGAPAHRHQPVAGKVARPRQSGQERLWSCRQRTTTTWSPAAPLGAISPLVPMKVEQLTRAMWSRHKTRSRREESCATVASGSLIKELPTCDAMVSLRRSQSLRRNSTAEPGMSLSGTTLT